MWRCKIFPSTFDAPFSKKKEHVCNKLQLYLGSRKIQIPIQIILFSVTFADDPFEIIRFLNPLVLIDTALLRPPSHQRPKGSNRGNHYPALVLMWLIINPSRVPETTRYETSNCSRPIRGALKMTSDRQTDRDSLANCSTLN